MVSPLTLPILGGALLTGVALGVHLGESSVGLINPIYFQGPAVHPRDRGVAIDESRPAPRPPAYGELYGWEEGASARVADCRDCEALRARAAYARDYSAEMPYFGGPAEAGAADVREATVPEVVVADEASAEEAVPDKPMIARYAHYPVVAEEVPEAPDVPPDDDYYQE